MRKFKKLVAVALIATMMVGCGTATNNETTPTPTTGAVEEAKPTEGLTEPTPTVTEEPSVTVEPTAEPTEAPTPTVEPTAEPTEAPTATPTEVPTPTPEPTSTPTPEPTEVPDNICSDCGNELYVEEGLYDEGVCMYCTVVCAKCEWFDEPIENCKLCGGTGRMPYDTVYCYQCFSLADELNDEGICEDCVAEQNSCADCDEQLNEDGECENCIEVESNDEKCDDCYYELNADGICEYCTFIRCKHCDELVENKYCENCDRHVCEGTEDWEDGVQERCLHCNDSVPCEKCGEALNDEGFCEPCLEASKDEGYICPWCEETKLVEDTSVWADWMCPNCPGSGFVICKWCREVLYMDGWCDHCQKTTRQ